MSPMTSTSDSAYVSKGATFTAPLLGYSAKKKK